MADRQPIRLNFWMTVCAIPALMLLIGLGTWQMQRLEWKEGIIAERAVRQAAPPLRISGIPMNNWQEYEHRRVTLRGTFSHSREILVLNAIRHGQTGYRLIVPFQTTDGRQILVDRGWVPKVWPNGQIERRRPGDSLDLIGTVRSGGKGTPWIPDNDPATDQWFYIDVAQMAAHAGLKDSLPYILRVTPDRREPGYPKGPHGSHKIRNKHLEYAITWYGLAATLVFVYLAYHFRRRRQED